MSSVIEQDRESLREPGEMQTSYREIFTTAIELLKTKGQKCQSAGIPFSHKVLRHEVNASEPKVYVEATTGTDLKKARKVSVYIDGMGRLEVRERGDKGQERFNGKLFLRNRIWGINLKSRPLHTDIVREYLGAIKRVRSEIIPQSH